MEEKIKEIILDIMGLNIDSVDKDRNLGEIDEWDSFNNLMVIAEIENSFSIKFTSQDIDGVNTINKIIALVKGKVLEK